MRPRLADHRFILRLKPLTTVLTVLRAGIRRHVAQLARLVFALLLRRSDKLQTILVAVVSILMALLAAFYYAGLPPGFAFFLATPRILTTERELLDILSIN